MAGRIVTIMLLIVAAIHLIPATGVLGVPRLNALYGVEIAGSELAILMRHRAVLFGLLGFLFAYAAFRRPLQGIALGIAAVSTLSFILLAALAGSHNLAIHKVVVADWFALACIFVAVIALGYRSRFHETP